MTNKSKQYIAMFLFIWYSIYSAAWFPQTKRVLGLKVKCFSTAEIGVNNLACMSDYQGSYRSCSPCNSNVGKVWEEMSDPHLKVLSLEPSPLRHQHPGVRKIKRIVLNSQALVFLHSSHSLLPPFVRLIVCRCSRWDSRNDHFYPPCFFTCKEL